MNTTCNCIEVVDKKLAAQNLRLTGFAYAMPTGNPVITIAVQWVDLAAVPKGRKKWPPKVRASHCPFCGVKYPQPEADAAAVPANN